MCSSEDFGSPSESDASGDQVGDQMGDQVGDQVGDQKGDQVDGRECLSKRVESALAG